MSSSDVSVFHRGCNSCVGVLDSKPVDEGIDQSDDEHDHLDDDGDDDLKDDDESNHQDNVVQDLRTRMAVLVVDVDHGNQKE